MVNRVTADRDINLDYCSDQLRADYAHVGLLDARSRRIWIARPQRTIPAIHLSHARLLRGGTQDTSTIRKDRFVCYWFHTPGTGEGHVHGYPIEWHEGHLLVRLEPNWDYAACQFIGPQDTARIERNIEQQYQWGRWLYRRYVERQPDFALSWHMVGPRAADSMFYIERHEPGQAVDEEV